MPQPIQEYKEGDRLSAGRLNEIVRQLNRLQDFTGDGNVLVSRLGGGVQISLAKKNTAKVLVPGTLSDDPSEAVSDTATAGISEQGSRDDHAHVGVHSMAKSGEAQLVGDVTFTGTTSSTDGTITLTQAGQNINIAVSGIAAATNVTSAIQAEARHKLVKVVSGGGTGTYSAYVVQEFDPSDGDNIGATIADVYINDDSTAIPADTVVGALFTSPAGVFYCWPFAIAR